MENPLNAGTLGGTLSNATASQSSGSTSPIAGIIGTALNILPFVAPEIGIPARIALGTLASAGANAVEGKPQSLTGDLMSGVSDGVLGGIGKGAGAAKEAEAAAGDAANSEATNAAESAVESPTNMNPDNNMGHVNFNTDANGNVQADTNNTFTEPQAEQQSPQQMPQTAPQAPIPNPASHTSTSDTFTQTNPQAYQSTLNAGQKFGQGLALPNIEAQIKQAGGNMSTAEVQQLARQISANGYGSLNDAASDGGLLTGNQGILSNGVRDHLNNADANGAVVDLSDYPNLIQGHVNEALNSGVLQPGQERVLQNATRQFQNLIGGVNPDTDTVGSLTYDQAKNTPISNAFNAVQAFEQAAARQGKIAQGRGISADGAKVLQKFYNNAANETMDRAFGSLGNGTSVSDDNIDNMISQLKSAPFKNKTMQANMISRLEQGKGGNLTIPQLRSLQSASVKSMMAASPDQVSNLTNGLMSAGLSKSGITNAVLNSTPALEIKGKIGQAITKGFTPSSGGSGALSGGIKGMSPIAKAALLTGILGGGGIALNAAGTANQSQQAQDLLNDPQYQKTQSILANQDALQRYLGEQGEIRSIFAPTFDSNAGSAGQTGAAMLQSANQNQAARTAAANLLAARAGMGQGGVLGDILSFIPGTAENNYKQQANNAIAQLNSQGVAGSAPSVAQSSASIPALAGIANSVGGF